MLKKITQSLKGNIDVLPDPPPPRKRVSRAKGRQGALRAVMNMPVDIILELCFHLDVPELLALSNTNKNFRAVVMGESSAKLFKAARERMGMPELLVPMSDLQYATLFFGRECHLCGKFNAGKVDVAFRARICRACYATKFIDAVRNYDKMSKLNPFTENCIHRHALRKGYDENPCYLEDLEQTSQRLNTEFPITSREVSSACWKWKHKSDEEKQEKLRVSGVAINDITVLLLDMYREYAGKLMNRKKNVRDPLGELETWLFTVDQERQLRDKDTEALEKWLTNFEHEKAYANRQLRRGRREEIENRMEVLGFDKSEFEVSEFVKHPQVTATRPLCSRTFKKNVELPIRHALEENRRERSRTILGREYEHAVVNHSNKVYLPPADSFTALPILQPVVNDVVQNPTKPLVLSKAESIKSLLPQEVLKLIRTHRERLVRSIVTAYLELAQERQASKEQAADNNGGNEAQNEEEEEEEEEKPALKTSTPIDRLPFTLPDLPSWVPRSQDAIIDASNEEIVSFLETSPLARFECATGCRRLLQTRELLEHFTERYWCGQSTSRSREFPPDLVQWITIEGVDDVKYPRIRINAEVLSLALKLQQVVDSAPLVVEEESPTLPDLGPKYSLGEIKRSWFHIELVCRCDNFKRGKSVDEMYAHIVKTRRSEHAAACGGVRPSASYRQYYVNQWRKQRSLKEAETGDFVRGLVDDPNSSCKISLTSSRGVLSQPERVREEACIVM